LRDLKGLGRKVKVIASMGETRGSVKLIKEHKNTKRVISGDSYDILKDSLMTDKRLPLSESMRVHYANFLMERCKCALKIVSGKV